MSSKNFPPVVSKRTFFTFPSVGESRQYFSGEVCRNRGDTGLGLLGVGERYTEEGNDEPQETPRSSVGDFDTFRGRGGSGFGVAESASVGGRSGIGRVPMPGSPAAAHIYPASHARHETQLLWRSSRGLFSCFIRCFIRLCFTFHPTLFRCLM